jgi:hypothetical protein
MASRAFTAMLTSAVSNWLASASTKQASPPSSVTISIPGAHDRAQHVRDGADAIGRVEHLGLERLAAGEGEELPGELGGAVHRVRDRVDVRRRALSPRSGRRSSSVTT